MCTKYGCTLLSSHSSAAKYEDGVTCSLIASEPSIVGLSGDALVVGDVAHDALNDNAAVPDLKRILGVQNPISDETQIMAVERELNRITDRGGTWTIRQKRISGLKCEWPEVFCWQLVLQSSNTTSAGMLL